MFIMKSYAFISKVQVWAFELLTIDFKSALDYLYNCANRFISSPFNFEIFVYKVELFEKKSGLFQNYRDHLLHSERLRLKWRQFLYQTIEGNTQKNFERIRNIRIAFRFVLIWNESVWRYNFVFQIFNFSNPLTWRRLLERGLYSMILKK